MLFSREPIDFVDVLLLAEEQVLEFTVKAGQFLAQVIELALPLPQLNLEAFGLAALSGRFA